MLERLRPDWTDGPPVPLPRLLDACSERWWALPPRLRALVLVGVALGVCAVLVADLGRAPHGPPVPVTVAVRDLPLGHDLAPGDLELRSWPRDLAPADTVEVTRTGTLLAPVPAGGALTEGVVGDGGVAALADEGAAVVAVPADLLPVHAAGTTVDLVAPAREGRATVLAPRARVLHVDEQRAWVEVADADAVDVAAAVRAEALMVVLRRG